MFSPTNQREPTPQVLPARPPQVAKYRGDEDRDFVAKEFDAKSFPTINLVKGGKATKYESEVRTAAALADFVAKA